ncbi:MmcQ/YjbR family DNA-binding protein [Loigolactobacillus binensis]|uniref:MmcQ/YjbR family DNA-binding protein n=1 Tax=Loigolactobacillus binensis TaxID=2559922 RepID=A0ABW3EB05_9LACO|nr:MmcQ/YjbR family DNA-binding protein [Loigolactobacillus binensis]
MDREAVLQYVTAKYNTQPEYPWRKYPHYAVLRHQHNRKWYAIIMDVKKENLDQVAGQAEDMMDLKLNPETVELLQTESGFLPAYHMNKSNWISVRISQVARDQICKLIDASYKLTEK